MPERQGILFSFSDQRKTFFLLPVVRVVFVVHTASHSITIFLFFFLGVKMASVWSWTLTRIQWRVQEWVELYCHFICVHGVNRYLKVFTSFADRSFLAFLNRIHLNRTDVLLNNTWITFHETSKNCFLSPCVCMCVLFSQNEQNFWLRIRIRPEDSATFTPHPLSQVRLI